LLDTETTERIGLIVGDPLAKVFYNPLREIQFLSTRHNHRGERRYLVMWRKCKIAAFA
jgi:hypothetical protein